MKKTEQYAMNAFRQAQVFLNENDAKVGMLNQTRARKQLDTAIAGLAQHGVDQAAIELQMDGFSNQQKTLETDLRTVHMYPIGAFARANLVGQPNYATLTRSPANLKGHQLVRAARAMVEAAQPYADDLTQAAFPADALAQLGQVANDLETSVDARTKLRVHRVNSTDAIVERTTQGKKALQSLSASINRQFATDRNFRAAWRSARRVVKPGVVSDTTTTNEPAQVPAPVVTAAK